MSKLAKVVTGALLENGIHIIDYNEIITKQEEDLEELRALIRRNGLMDAKLTKDLENKINQLQAQAGDWKTLKNIHRNKATHIIIMMEVEETK
jgi:hypothetical protein